MTIDRNYRCDLCRDLLPSKLSNGGIEAIGLYWTGTVIQERQPHDVEHHLCFKCLAGLQGFVAACGAGFRNCTGGPKCGSDHK